jgi:hypothetical protein
MAMPSTILELRPVRSAEDRRADQSPMNIFLNDGPTGDLARQQILTLYPPVLWLAVAFEIQERLTE